VSNDYALRPRSAVITTNALKIKSYHTVFSSHVACFLQHFRFPRQTRWMNSIKQAHSTASQIETMISNRSQWDFGCSWGSLAIFWFLYPTL